MSCLRIDLRYRAGARELVSTLDTDAERIAIVGPSGVGKTSLLRAVLGLDPEARGLVALRGERLDGLPIEARACGWVPQDAALFPHLEVRGNLAFAARAPIEPYAELTRIRALLDRPVGELSGGERQRVAIARALARQPRLLLLDEPLSALDRAARGDVATAIERERAARGSVLLLTSHDEMDVAALADEVYEMDVEGTLTRRSSPG